MVAEQLCHTAMKRRGKFTSRGHPEAHTLADTHQQTRQTQECSWPAADAFGGPSTGLFPPVTSSGDNWPVFDGGLQSDLQTRTAKSTQLTKPVTTCTHLTRGCSFNYANNPYTES